MRVVSIFTSIDGEVNWWGQGSFSTFIRLAGCNLRCSYCDTKWAQSMDAGQEMSIEKVVAEVMKAGCRKVTITGGEPLLQYNEVEQLIKDLYYIARVDKVSIETNGTIRPTFYNSRVSYIVDYKLPSSGMEEKMLPLNDVYSELWYKDFVKFVIMSALDYERAKKIAESIRKLSSTRIAFSLGFPQFIPPSKFIQWMHQDGLTDYVVNFQLHKLVNLIEDSQKNNEKN